MKMSDLKKKQIVYDCVDSLPLRCLIVQML